MKTAKTAKKILAFTLCMAILMTVLAVPAMVSAFNPPASATMKKAVTPPVIDGNVSAAEWGEPMWSFVYTGTDLSDAADTATEFWVFSNDADLDLAAFLKQTKVDFYAMWDEDHLYFGIITDNQVDVPPNMDESEIASLWNSRCIQFEWVSPGDVFNDIGFNTDGAGKTNQFWFMGEEAGNPMSHNAKVVKTGNVVVYEIAMKWSDLYLSAPSAGQALPMTVSFNFHKVYDGGGFTALQMGGAIMTKNPDAHLPVTLSGEPAVVAVPETPAEPDAPAAVEEAPPAATPVRPAAPQTGDAGMIFVVILAIASAGVLVFRKKIFN